jgi:hypothetical protein
MHLQTFLQYPFRDEDVREFRNDKPISANTQTRFNLLYPHNVRQFDSDLQISFLQDDYRTFMISPADMPTKIDDAETTGPEIIDKTSDNYPTTTKYLVGRKHNSICSGFDILRLRTQELNYLDEASRFVIGYAVSDESTNITVLEDSFTRYGKILELLSEPLMKFRDGLKQP